VSRSYFRAHKQVQPAKPVEQCPLCGESATLVQDHCHETGLNRDRICTRCNNLLGRLEWKPERLEALRDYIIYWQWEHRHGGLSYRAGDLVAKP
jgi:hypothetical protein